jgi:AAA+ ATPase superfamily predicted ATPase
LAKQTTFPFLKATDWGDLFTVLAKETQKGRVIILLDEISWMGSKDPHFLGKLKNAWDMEFKQNPELMLILCGSISSWIEENILKSTGFMGRISLTLYLQELKLPECNHFLDLIGFRGCDYERFKILSVTGGIPRYLEEIQPHLPAEANLQELCFQPGGILFREFNDIFSDLFSHRSPTYKKILASLVTGAKELAEIAKDTNLSPGGHLSACLHDLNLLGFIRRDYSWSIKKGKEARLSQFRLNDNYLRFYLKYIEPQYEKIASGHFPKFSLAGLTAWDSIMGLQFENMVIASRELVWKHLPFSAADIVNDNPYFQRKTSRIKGCQIDYLIQTRYHNLFVCEIKFSRNCIGLQIVDEVKEKISNISLPRGFSCWPVLIHVNGVSDAVVDSGYFTKIIDFSTLL